MVGFVFFFFQAEDGIRDLIVTGVQTCALPILASRGRRVTCNGEDGARPGSSWHRLHCGLHDIHGTWQGAAQMTRSAPQPVAQPEPSASPDAQDLVQYSLNASWDIKPIDPRTGQHLV